MTPDPRKLHALHARCEAEYDEGLSDYEASHPVQSWLCKLTVIFRIGASCETQRVVHSRDPDGACYFADAWAHEYFKGVDVVIVTNARRVV